MGWALPQTTSRLWAVLTGAVIALAGLAYIILGGWLATLAQDAIAGGLIQTIPNDG